MALCNACSEGEYSTDSDTCENGRKLKSRGLRPPALRVCREHRLSVSMRIPSELIETAFAARTDSECSVEAGFKLVAFSYMPKLCQQKLFAFWDAYNLNRDCPAEKIHARYHSDS